MRTMLRANEVDINNTGAFTGGLARKIAVHCGHMYPPLESVCVYPRIGGRPPHHGDAGRDHPDAWVPATQLKGHNEKVG